MTSSDPVGNVLSIVREMTQPKLEDVESSEGKAPQPDTRAFSSDGQSIFA